MKNKKRKIKTPPANPKKGNSKSLPENASPVCYAQSKDVRKEYREE